MSYATGTTHYNLPQTVGTDKRDWTDTNQAFADLDTAVYSAATTASAASTAASNAASAASAADTKATNAASAASAADTKATNAASAASAADTKATRALNALEWTELTGSFDLSNYKEVCVVLGTSAAGRIAMFVPTNAIGSASIQFQMGSGSTTTGVAYPFNISKTTWGAPTAYVNGNPTTFDYAKLFAR